MRRWSRSICGMLACVSLLLNIWQVPVAGLPDAPTFSTNAQKQTAAQETGLEVRVSAWGPNQALINQTIARLPSQTDLRNYLQDKRYRLLSFELGDSDKNLSAPPDAFKAIYYDYTDNQTVHAEGKFDGHAKLRVSAGNYQPLPSNEEYEAAVSVLLRDPKIGPSLSQRLLVANPAMPPVLYPDTSLTGSDLLERTVNVLLLPTGKGSLQSEVVGVNMVRNSIVHFPGGAPPTSMAASSECGIPSADQSTTDSGTAGQYQFEITQSGVTLWSFLAIRPATSSGLGDRSGIELRDVRYKGKLLLKRMHTPILNVDYDGGACGPFRDWQWQEGMFQADGTDVPGTNGGVRDCGNTPAMTALETNDDRGNFRGIAFYRQNNEVVLVSEMNAGWYRYICEYRFDKNGTIRPRYGYGATTNSCVCFAHAHHIYWRFDFDIGGSADNVIRPSRREFSWGSPYSSEVRIHRGARQNWLVQNTKTLDGYMIRPNSHDGSAAQGSYGRGDLWFVLFKATEISDKTAGVFTGTPANLDAFVTGEALNTDPVIWYAAHFYHDDGGNKPTPLDTAPRILTGHHVQGPDLMPVRW
jgi:hypothetical protein